MKAFIFFFTSFLFEYVIASEDFSFELFLYVLWWFDTNYGVVGETRVIGSARALNASLARKRQVPI